MFISLSLPFPRLSSPRLVVGEAAAAVPHVLLVWRAGAAGELQLPQLHGAGEDPEEARQADRHAAADAVHQQRPPPSEARQPPYNFLPRLHLREGVYVVRRDLISSCVHV